MVSNILGAFLRKEKNNKIARSVAYVCTLLLAVVVLSPSASANNRVYDHKYSAFIMDADTGLVLYRKNAGKALHPASLTKMMTLYMLFDAIERGDLTLKSRIRMSRHAASMVPSKLGLEPGSTIKVKDAIYALVTKSANDVAVAVAEKLGKTESNFATMMTKKARSLGMTKTRFKNASGLHDKRQVSTARDMAKLAQAIIVRHKKYYHYFSTKSFTYKGKTYRSHNKLVGRYVGMDGMKTGYIQASGFNLVSSAVRNNSRLIGVVFGGKTSKSRNLQMEILLDNAFERLGILTIANASVPMPLRKPTSYSKERTFEVAQSDAIEKIKEMDHSRWSMLDGKSVFGRMAGEGDLDAGVRNRIETGLIAISAHLDEDVPPQFLSMSKVDALNSKEPSVGAPSASKSVNNMGAWSIQIGAFSSRERTDRAIVASMGQLPKSLRHAHTTIAPVKTKQGWIYRGRINGYSKKAAKSACDILSDCIPILPKAH